ncbi:MAG TPA: hypothetical protein VNH83_31605 [Bryobacteraceae bacterium]|nr:hypothetical protein [Bryobacteraceae bacterium]
MNEPPLSEPVRAPVAEAVQTASALEPELAKLTPAEFSLSTELEAELTEIEAAELGAEFAPDGEPGTAPPDRWNSDDSQSTASAEPDTEPFETPKV